MEFWAINEGAFQCDGAASLFFRIRRLASCGVSVLAERPRKTGVCPRRRRNDYRSLRKVREIVGGRRRPAVWAKRKSNTCRGNQLRPPAEMGRQRSEAGLRSDVASPHPPPPALTGETADSDWVHNVRCPSWVNRVVLIVCRCAGAVRPTSGLFVCFSCIPCRRNSVASKLGCVKRLKRIDIADGLRVLVPLEIAQCDVFRCEVR